ncbi:unnamed protein product, partial [Strongylus vulgaris]
PPPPVRRERLRRRPSVPTVVEEPNTALPVLISLPAPGAVSAPLTVVVPAEAPPDPAPQAPSTAPAPIPAAAIPPHPRESVEHPPPPPRRTVVPENLAASRAVSSNIPTQTNNIQNEAVPTSFGSSQASAGPEVPEVGRGTTQGMQQVPLPSRNSAQTHSVLPPHQSVLFQEVPLSTPAAPAQAQPIVQLPEEMPPLNTQPATPLEGEPNRPQLVREQPAEQGRQAAAGTATVENNRPENAGNNDEARERERQADDENVNLM